jgi:glucoside 3-dehydrogenase (cytochrome c) hitch-hiker subunit
MEHTQMPDGQIRAGDVSRRSALKALGTGVAAFVVWPELSAEAAEAFAQAQKSQAAPKLVFLSPDQYATVDALAEAIIPADEHSPGARAARVADYMDLLLKEATSETQKNWTEGLAEVDRVSAERYKSPFAKLTAAQQNELLTEISKNEENPQTTLEKFFKATKDATIRGYYTSEIGIQQELEYKGNVFLAEFVGCTHPEHGYKSE